MRFSARAVALLCILSAGSALLAQIGSPQSSTAGLAQQALPQVLPADPIVGSPVTDGTGSVQRPIYGAFWEVGPYSTSALILAPSGKGGKASLILRDLTGSVIATTDIKTSPLSAVSFSLSSLLPQDAKVRRGSLLLSWSGLDKSPSAKVEVHQEGGIEASYLMHSGFKSNSGNRLFAPWYLPQSSTSGMLSLFNCSSSPIKVNVSVLVEGAKKHAATVEVSASETKELNLRQILSDAATVETSMGAVLLEYEGSHNSLQPRLLLSDSSTGFALMPDFLPEASVQSESGVTDWQYPDIQVAAQANDNSVNGRNVSYALFTNPSSQPVDIGLHVYSMKDWKEVRAELPHVTLKAFETRVLSINDELSQAYFDHTLGRVGLSVEHPGVTGRVGFTLYTTTRNGQVLTSPKPIAVPARTSQIALWDAKASHEGTTFRMTLKSEKPTVTLYYSTSWGVQHYNFAPSLFFSRRSGMRFRPNLSQTHHGADANVPAAGISGGLIVVSSTTPTEEQIQSLQPSCIGNCEAMASSVSSERNLAAQPNDTIDDSDPPQACITYNGTCEHSQTITVSVGQQISADGVIPIPNSYQSQVWDWDVLPTDRAVGCSSGYTYSGSTCGGSDIMTASTTSGYQPTSYPLPSLTNPNGSADSSGSNYTLWFVYPPDAGSTTLHFNYTTADGATPADPATLTIMVQSAPAALMTVSNSNTASISQLSGCSSGNEDLSTYGHLTGSCSSLTSNPAGITFNAPSSLTSGTINWDQLVSSRSTVYTTSPNNVTCSYTAGLDTTYPYASGNYANDSPASQLVSAMFSGSSDTIAATMYMLWQPSGSNSIFVPLSYVTWQANFNATYSPTTSGNVDGWVSSGGGSLSGSGATASAHSQTNMGYPNWSSLLTKQPCH